VPAPRILICDPTATDAAPRVELPQPRHHLNVGDDIWIH